MYKILIADDEALMRKGLCTLIDWAKLGCQIVGTAENGLQAKQAVLDYQPDIIIADIKMPVMDGLDATRAIRAMERPDAALPIIAMTANLFDEDVAACLAAGMDAHIPKPLEAGQMIRTIAEWLERKK